MPKHLAIKADWKTPELLIEGSLNCAKTTVMLDKEIDALLKWPGIPILLFRWADDAVQTKLRPAFEDILDIRGIDRAWDDKKKRFEFSNGSLAYMFGLKAVSIVEQFNKIRGLGVSRLAGDQVEEMARAVAGELRGRLRPDLKATMNQTRYPFQLTFVANPDDEDFWLSKEFPTDNHVKGRKLYSLSIFDNKHLPHESVESLLRQYPEGHPKHLTMVMGQRGPNITGDPIYEGIYRKDLHHRPVVYRQTEVVYEGYEFGKHNPCWVCAQPLYAGGLAIIGGIIGEGMMLQDFLPIVQRYRHEWLPLAKIQSCAGPMGDKVESQRQRFTILNILRKAGVKLTWRDNANAPDVRLAMIENIAGYLRRRNTKGEELLAVNSDATHWLKATTEGIKEYPFLHFALEGGYVWDDHLKSVSNATVRIARDDDKFANAMRCVENIELNFTADRQTEEEIDRRRQLARQKAANSPGMSYGANSWMGF